MTSLPHSRVTMVTMGDDPHTNDRHPFCQRFQSLMAGVTMVTIVLAF